VATVHSEQEKLHTAEFRGTYIRLICMAVLYT
jgi:hypothetical protein